MLRYCQCMITCLIFIIFALLVPRCVDREVMSLCMFRAYMCKVGGMNAADRTRYLVSV